MKEQEKALIRPNEGNFTRFYRVVNEGNPWLSRLLSRLTNDLIPAQSFMLGITLAGYAMLTFNRINVIDAGLTGLTDHIVQFSTLEKKRKKSQRYAAALCRLTGCDGQGQGCLVDADHGETEALIAIQGVQGITNGNSSDVDEIVMVFSTQADLAALP